MERKQSLKTIVLDLLNNSFLSEYVFLFIMFNTSSAPTLFNSFLRSSNIDLSPFLIVIPIGKYRAHSVILLH